ncbi:uncharacterized protein LOC144880393 [Branchiostoma floridae x Branchiostoma japonicum]
MGSTAMALTSVCVSLRLDNNSQQGQAAPQAHGVNAQQIGQQQGVGGVPGQAAQQAGFNAQQGDGAMFMQRLQLLEQAHHQDAVADALDQVLDLAKTPSELNRALLIPALQRLEERARVSGHADHAKYSATLRHSTMYASSSILGEMVLQALGSEIDERIGAKFSRMSNAAEKRGVQEQQGGHVQQQAPVQQAHLLRSQLCNKYPTCLSSNLLLRLSSNLLTRLFSNPLTRLFSNLLTRLFSNHRTFLLKLRLRTCSRRHTGPQSSSKGVVSLTENVFSAENGAIPGLGARC